MKIAVIGAGMFVTGRGTSGHGTVLSALAQASKSHEIEEVAVLATSDKNAPLIQRVVREINAKLGSNLKVTYRNGRGPLRATLSDTMIQAAIVSVPDHLHHSITTELLEMGAHCLVVKPLTPTLSEATSLVNLQKSKKLYGCVEFHKRLDETNLIVKRILAEKRLGDLKFFDVHFSQRLNIPLTVFSSWAEKTNIFNYLGVHYIDLIWFLTGAYPTRAMGIGTKGLLSSKGIDTFDSVHSIVEWTTPNETGTTFISNLSVDWIDPENTTALSDQSYRVVGSLGRIECDQKNRGLELITTGQNPESINPYFSQFLPEEDGSFNFSGYGFRSIERFISDVELILSGTITPGSLEGKRPTFSSALISTAVIDAVTQSLTNHSKWIPINALT